MTGHKKSIKCLRKLLKRSGKLLDKHGIKFVLFYGTLLGLVRSNELIENDDDVDILVHCKDREKVKSLKVHHYGDANDSIIQIYFSKTLGPCDIYFYEETEKDLTIPWDYHLTFNREDIFPLISIEYSGRNFLIPRNPEKILEDTYGAQWRIPTAKENYDYNVVDGKSIVIYFD